MCLRASSGVVHRHRTPLPLRGSRSSGPRSIGSRLVLATQRPAVRPLAYCWFICYIMSIIYAPVYLGHRCWHVARSRSASSDSAAEGKASSELAVTTSGSLVTTQPPATRPSPKPIVIDLPYESVRKDATLHNRCKQTMRPIAISRGLFGTRH